MFEERARIEAPADVLRGLGSQLLRTLLILRAIIRFAKRKPIGAIGAGVFFSLVSIAILAPLISPHDPEATHGHQFVYASPGNPVLPLGGDNLGRDVMSRLFHGSRISLFVGAISVLIGITGGSLFGIVSAYWGGAFDLLMQRLVDAFMAFPAIILGLAIVAVLGSSITNVIIALVFVLTPTSIRTVRSQALAIKEMDYILAARAVGATPWRIVLRHIVPNCVALFIILATLNLGFAIIVEASLSFLGAGVPPNVPTWGGMLSEAGTAYVRTAPWLAVFPGIAIALTVLAVNLFGDALRDVLDPRLRGTS